MLDAIKLTLSSVALPASTTIAGCTVTRFSLFGFEIQGPTRAHVLDLDEAAEILARAAHHAAVAVQTPSASSPAAPPLDLLQSPRELSPGSGKWTETWRESLASCSRYAALRRAFGAANVHKRTCRSPGFVGLSATVEIRWNAPRGAVVPQIPGVRS
jgi:hypothetical protein